MEGFVEKINLILESKEFLYSSFNKKYIWKFISKNFIHLLNEVKDECKNTISEKIIYDNR